MLTREATPRAYRIERRLVEIQDRIAAHKPDYEIFGPISRLVRDIESGTPPASMPRSRPDLKAGEQLYARACAPCHGDDGNGRSTIARQMAPAPTNIVHPEHSWRPYDMFLRTTYGGIETAMPSFAQGLSAQERWNIVFFLFAKRWPPCETKAPAVSASVLATSSDFDLGTRYGYKAIACLRRNFSGP
jgi:mono/diheme cytochrome c family protein